MTGRPLAGAYGLYYLQDRPLLLRAGSFSAPLHPPERWEGRLAALLQGGCNAVLLAVPWSWHAPAPERIDLSGETDPGRDLGRLLGLIESVGLLCLLQASPPGDYPPWLASRLPQALALDPGGRPFRGPGAPVFSLLHPDLLQQLRAWYRALGACIAPHSGRPMVAWHLDGGTGGPFAGRAGELDFNPHTVERYRRFLRERYDSARLLAREWRRAIPDFEEVLPPRDRQSPGELADWQAFLEHSVAQHVERLAALAREAAPGLPVGTASVPPFVSPEAPGLVAPQVDFYGYGSPSRPAGSTPLRPGSPSRAAGRGPRGSGETSRRAGFGASVQALRFEPYSADSRPLTAHSLGAVHDLLAAVAHGAKGYSLAPDALPLERDAGGGTDALVRLQHWIAGAEEELTASVEVRDPIAYLDYPLYWRYTPDDPPPPRGALPDAEPGGDRFGLLALLLTCGYNPTVLDLGAIGDAELTEFPVAVFPSRGILRLDDYGKLVVFTLRGGALVTFPEPATREVDGTPLNTRFLWPHLPAPPSFAARLREGLPGPFGSRLRPPLHDAVSGERLPAEVARALPGPWRTFPDAARPFVRYGRAGRGEVPRAAPEAVQAQVLLTAGGDPLAYRVQVRSGTSTVLGVPLGAPLSTPAYATLSPAVRRALRRLALRLFEEGAPRQIVPEEDLEVEAVARLSPDGGALLFVLNRLGAPQVGRLRFPQPGALNLGSLGADVRAEVLYSVAGSGAVGESGGVRLDLAPGESLVLRLT